MVRALPSLLCLAVLLAASCHSAAHVPKGPPVHQGSSPQDRAEASSKPKAPLSAELSWKRQLAAELRRVGQACGQQPLVVVEWELVARGCRPYRASGPDNLLSALRTLCNKPGGKALVARIKTLRYRPVGRFSLRFTGAELLMEGDPKKVGGSSSDFYYALEAARLSDTMTVGEWIGYRGSVVCVGTEQTLIIAPRTAKRPGISFGRGGRFRWLPMDEIAGPGWFFDPRHYNRNHHSMIRGRDLRHFSRAEANPSNGTCRLKCGVRERTLRLASRPEAEQILQAARYERVKAFRQPHALARDRRGRYYYVDRAGGTEESRDFRVYMGRRGRLKLLAMVDVINDSEGQIFATKNGRLRLLVGRERAQWLTRARTFSLTTIPVMKNLRLIYNELGPYLGQPLQTPCDVF